MPIVICNLYNQTERSEKNRQKSPWPFGIGLRSQEWWEGSGNVTTLEHVTIGVACHVSDSTSERQHATDSDQSNQQPFTIASTANFRW